VLASTSGKLRGNKGMAICPFHGEKTASMSFTDEENLFHCFGCKEGGDIFKYVQLINNIEFQESVEVVAEKYAFNLKYSDSQFESNQKSLIQMMKIISDYFIANIEETKSTKPKKYLISRKIDNEAIKKFKLGFAELDEKIFYDFCNKNDISKQNLKSLGLLSEKQNLLFRERILFPITNFRNETVAYGGRALNDFGPKYLNSAESQIYKKNKTLYFTDNFLKSVKEKDEIIIVEGYIDVIAFNLLGYSNVASPSGTALTSQQLEQLSKYSSNIIISFDNDDAGINATNRILEIKNSTSRDLYLKCMLLPEEYKDIGEYYEDGKDNLDFLLSNKIDLIEFSIDSLIKKEDTGDKRIIFSEFKKLIRSLSPLDQDFAFDILSVKINTPKDLLEKELKHKKSIPTYGESSSSQNESNKHIEAFQDIFISSLIKNEFEDVSEFEDLLNSSDELFNIIKKLQSGQNKDISSNFINISFTENQLQEAISRLYIHYFEIKINTLISELEVSNDTNIFSEIENLKKKIENYQNTL
jgi:DNA primase